MLASGLLTVSSKARCLIASICAAPTFCFEGLNAKVQNFVTISVLSTLHPTPLPSSPLFALFARSLIFLASVQP